MLSGTLGFSIDRLEADGLVIKPPAFILVYVENADGVAPANDSPITHELARIALDRLRRGKSGYWSAQVALRATGMPAEDARIERVSDLVAHLIVTEWPEESVDLIKLRAKLKSR